MQTRGRANDNSDSTEKMELRNPYGSFHANNTALQYEGANNQTFLTVSFESREKFFFERDGNMIYNVYLREDEVYPGLVSMIETVSPLTIQVESINVTTNAFGSKVKLFDLNRLSNDCRLRNLRPWIIALIVALVLLAVIKCLCCCNCWKRRREARDLNKIHANYT